MIYDDNFYAQLEQEVKAEEREIRIEETNKMYFEEGDNDQVEADKKERNDYQAECNYAPSEPY